MATRCCWPPESAVALKFIRSASPTAPSSSAARAFMVDEGKPSSPQAGSMTFSSAVNIGKR
ncbi:hypothetical protein WME90_06420 [Sorangium sp. So ce375]